MRAMNNSMRTMLFNPRVDALVLPSDHDEFNLHLAGFWRGERVPADACGPIAVLRGATAQTA